MSSLKKEVAFKKGHAAKEKETVILGGCIVFKKPD